jgi:hypothetical protein
VSGKGSAGTNWGATEKGYGETLALALQAAARRLSSELSTGLRTSLNPVP